MAKDEEDADDEEDEGGEYAEVARVILVVPSAGRPKARRYSALYARYSALLKKGALSEAGDVALAPAVVPLVDVIPSRASEGLLGL